jgi:hypothetical protein
MAAALLPALTEAAVAATTKVAAKAAARVTRTGGVTNGNK